MDETRNAPIEEGSTDSANEERVQGVLAQVRADIDMGHTHERVLTLLRERFAQANLDVSDDRLTQLAAKLTDEGRS